MAVVSTDWLNQNAYRAYPLRDGVSGVSSSTSWAIPWSLIVDVSIYVPLDISPTEVFISEIAITGSVVKISFSDASETIATCIFDYVDHQNNETYPIRGAGTNANNIYGRLTGGFISIDQAEIVPGTHQFNFSSAALSTICTRPSPVSVTSLVVAGQPIRGDIQLLGGRGVSISSSGNEITIAADIESSLSLSDCGCEDSIDNCIKTINGVEPDENGNVNIEGVDCVNVVNDFPSHQIILSDTCSQPCCDCEGLEIMARNIEELQQRTIEVVDFIRDIQRRIDVAASYLESRI